MLEKVDSLKSSIKHSVSQNMRLIFYWPTTSLLTAATIHNPTINLITQINQRYVPSNLRDGLIFLTEVQKFSEVRNLMSCVIKRIDHFNSRVSTISNSDFANDVRHSEKSSTDSCTLKGELIQTSSTMAILIVVDDSVRNMLLFASRYASTVAIPLGEFSVGCDIARYHLKLVEESTKKVENDLTGRTESASNDSMMWVLRALSFAGLGTSHMHHRKIWIHRQVICFYNITQYWYFYMMCKWYSWHVCDYLIDLPSARCNIWMIVRAGWLCLYSSSTTQILSLWEHLPFKEIFDRIPLFHSHVITTHSIEHIFSGDPLPHPLPHLKLPHLTSPHHISSLFISHHSTLPYLTLPYLTQNHLP